MKFPTGRILPLMWIAGLLALVMACDSGNDNVTKRGEPAVPLEFESATQFAAITVANSSLCLSGTTDANFLSPKQIVGYPFAALANDTAVVTIAGSPNFDTLVAIFGPADDAGFYGEVPIASDDDGGPGSLSQLSYTFKDTGAYLLVVTTYDGVSQGTIQVTLTLNGEAGCGSPSAPDCDDGDPCTDDVFNADGTCGHMPSCGLLSCDDSDPCTDDVFDSATSSCLHTAVANCGEEPVFEEPPVEEPVLEEPAVEEPVFEDPPVNTGTCDADSCGVLGENFGELCHFTNVASGDTLDCQLRLAHIEGLCTSVAIQFQLSYDASALTLVDFLDEICFGNNGGAPCTLASVGGGTQPANSLLSTGHSVTKSPKMLDKWAGKGGVVMVNLGVPETPLSDAVFHADGSVTGDALVMTVRFQVKSGAGASSATINIQDVVASSATPATQTISVKADGLLVTTGLYCDGDPTTGSDSDTDGDGDPDSTDCAPQDASNGAFAAELCNGQDDDCDGVVDEDFSGVGSYCNDDPAVSGCGLWTCSADGLGMTCEPTPGLCDNAGGNIGKICTFLGLEEGEHIDCQVRMARQDGTAAPTAMQFVMTYDPTTLTLVDFMDNLCFGPNETEPCFLTGVGAAPSGATLSLSTGHQLTMSPKSVDKWSGQGGVVLLNLQETATPLSEAIYHADGTVNGNSDVMTVRFLATKGLAATQATSVILGNIVTANGLAQTQAVSVKVDGLIVSQGP